MNPESSESASVAVSPARSRADLVALAWLPALLYTSLIWWLSSQPVFVEGLDRFPFQDKGIHFLEYGGLCLTIYFAIDRTWPGRGVRAALSALLITTGLGLLDEFHQSFVPSRSSDVADLAADFVGSLVFSFSCYLVLRLRAARTSPKAPSPS